MPDLFISYSRRDTEFVRKLATELQNKGREIWVDWEDIPLTADWWKEIQDGIDASDAFVFIISPDSVQSEVCRQELEHAINTNKRFVPVLYREIETKEDREAMHPAISSHNWLFFRETDDFNKSFKSLNDVVDLDLEHTKNHTRLLIRATEWDNGNRDRSFLLNGDEITNAENWLSHGVSKIPKPTELHSEYIFASRAAANRRQQQLLAGVSVALVISVILAIAAVFGFTQANEQRQRAEEQQAIAERNAEVSASLNLATSAQLAITNELNELGLILARESIRIDDPPSQAREILEEITFARSSTRVFSEHEERVDSVIVNADGTQILSTDRNGATFLWDAQTQEIIQSFPHDDRVHKAIFTPGGDQILTTASDGLIRLWDIASGEVIREYTDESTAVAQNIDFLPDGDRFVATGNDSKLVLWDFETADILQTYEGQHESQIVSVAVLPDGESFISTDFEANVLQWNVEDATVMQRFPDHGRFTMYAAVNSDGTRLLTADGSGVIRYWNIETGDLIHRMEGHGGLAKEVVFSPEERFAISVSDAGNMVIWDLANGSLVQRFNDHGGFVDAVDVFPNGQFAVTGSGDQTIRIWEIVNGAQLTAYNGHSDNVLAVLLDHENGRFFSSANDIIEWDLETGELVRRFDPDAHDDVIRDLALSPDGTTLASGSDDRTITLWDLETGDPTMTLTDGHEGLITTVLFNPAGDLLYSAAVEPDNAIVVWDLETGQVVDRLERHTNPIESLVFNVDGTRLVSGSQDNTIILWDVETGEPITTFEGPENPVLAVDISPDETAITAASVDNTVRVWDIETAQQTHLFTGHTNSVDSVDFHPEGGYVLSGAADATIRVWDLETGEEVRRIVTDASIEEVFYAPDGNTAFSASDDSIVHQWEVTPLTLDDILAIGDETRYLRDFNCDERDTYRLDPCEEPTTAENEG